VWKPNKPPWIATGKEKKTDETGKTIIGGERKSTEFKPCNVMNEAAKKNSGCKDNDIERLAGDN
jgi:hypothetical protein